MSTIGSFKKMVEFMLTCDSWRLIGFLLEGTYLFFMAFIAGIVGLETASGFWVLETLMEFVMISSMLSYTAFKTTFLAIWVYRTYSKKYPLHHNFVLLKTEPALN